MRSFVIATIFLRRLPRVALFFVSAASLATSAARAAPRTFGEFAALKTFDVQICNVKCAPEISEMTNKMVMKSNGYLLLGPEHKMLIPQKLLDA